MFRKIRRPVVLGLVALLVMTPMLGQLAPTPGAYASPFSTASSEAFGVSGNLSVVGIPIVTIPETPVSSGAAPPAYADADSTLSLDVDAIAPLVATASVETGLLETTATSPVPVTDSSSASATVNDLNVNLRVATTLLGLTLTADTVQSTAQVVATGGQCTNPPTPGGLTASSTTTVENLNLDALAVVLGLPILADLAGDVSVPPNTTLGTLVASILGATAGTAVDNVLALLGVSIILHEQVITGDGTTNRAISVNAIHIQVGATGILGPLMDVDVIIGHSEAALTCTAQAAQTADVSITKTDSPDPVVVGNPLTYTLTVNNAGPNAATNVVVTDTPPATTTFVSATAPCTHAAGVVTCNLGTLAPNTSTVLQITVIPTAPSTNLLNVASVLSATPDPNGTNNNVETSTTVNAGVGTANVGITKSASPNPATAGQPLTYTLNVANAGPDAAPNVVVTDTLPAGVTFGSATPSQGGPCTNAAGVVTCPLGTIAANGTATVTIVITPPTAGTIVNSATVTSGAVDPNGANNNTQITTTVNQGGAGAAPDLTIAKVANPSPAVAGSSLTYSLTVTNPGSTPATNVTVTDNLPSGVSFGSVSATGGGQCSQSNGTVTCTFASIPANSGVIVTIVVTPQNAGTIVNSASVSSPSDPNPANNNTQTSTTVNGAAASNLTITKKVEQSSPILNFPLTFTIRVTNTGNAPATNVVVTDDLNAAGVNLTTATPSQGSCSGTVVCNLGTIQPGNSATITLLVNPPNVGGFRQRAVVTSDQGGAQVTTSFNVDPDGTQDDDDDERRRRERREDLEERTEQENTETQGNVLAVRCAPFTPTPIPVPPTPIPAPTATPMPTTAPVPPPVAPPAPPPPPAPPVAPPPAPAPVQAPQSLEEVPAAGSFSALAIGFGQLGSRQQVIAEDDGVDAPYVIIGTMDGTQKIRLYGDAQLACSSFRVGDYVEADGQKVHEGLFDADNIELAD